MQPDSISGVGETFAAWAAGKSFSTDWTSRLFPVWAEFLAHRRDEALDVLEIGSWEGRSALFFLRFLPACRLVCIDTFAGSSEHVGPSPWAGALPDVEARFDANLAEFAGRFEKMKTTSYKGLAQLISADRRFDVVLVDGSHHSADAQADLVMAWPLIRDGGLVILDDYEWTFYPDAVRRPKLGLDSVLATHPGEYRELFRDYQLILEKAGPRPAAAAPG